MEKKMVKCKDLLENVKDQKARDWFLENIHEKEIRERMFFTDKDNNIDELFSITNGQDQDKEHERRNAIIKQGTFDNQIQGGIYNVFMPDKNTYFHAAIASDLTKSTLEILQHIKKVADENKLKLEDLVPFKQMDSGEYGPKKNFLMLAIAKKYDNVDFEPFFIPKMTEEEYDKEKELIEKTLKKTAGLIKPEAREQLSNSLYEDLKAEKKSREHDRTILHKDHHYSSYNLHDAALIKWLIDNAPNDCLIQKDGEGYNIVDYALMKMDKEILEQLLKKDKERKLGLLQNSKLLKKIYCNNFNYEEASKMVKKRYGMTPAIANRIDWYNQKRDVLGVLNTYIDNCKDEELKKIKSMAANSNLKNALNKDMHFGIKG